MNATFPLRNVTFSLNHFADLSTKEFKQLILMPPQKPHLIPKQRQDPCYNIAVHYNNLHCHF